MPRFFGTILTTARCNPSANDRERSRRIESLLGKYSAGSLKERDRTELDNLVEADYQAAAARADRLIAAHASQAEVSRNATRAKEPIADMNVPAGRSTACILKD
jgi:hypothetical protein